jgi:exodeoxyribonuclease VIII
MLADGIEPVSASDFEQALSMAAAVHSHPTAGALLQSGMAEQSFWWDDIATGMRCKCRPDWFDGTTIVDLKTCQDASPAPFGKSVANFGYQIQSAHYLAGTLAKRFIFVAVEKTYPFGIGVYELDAEALVHGSIARHNALQRIQDCRAIGEWPGYTDGIQMLQLPGWALKDNTSITSEDF